MTASIGAAVFPDDAFTESELIRKADLALDWAKASGRNSIQFYSPTMARGRRQRLIVEGDLRRALERSQFHLLYQPKRNIAGGGITGVEALLRWTHPEQGIITPTSSSCSPRIQGSSSKSDAGWSRRPAGR